MSGQVGKSNQTLVTEFVLQGFLEHPQLWLPLLSYFFFLYTLALVGNTLIITIITCSSCLHSPMYFFLFNLATMDISCTSSVIPKALASLSWKENIISFHRCKAQLFFLAWSGSSELLLLTVMAYDRYVAICRPLHYGNLMSLQLCLALAVAVSVTGALNASVHTCLMAQLSFCGPNVITHFFCEIPPLLLLSCSPTYINSIMTFLADTFLGAPTCCSPSCRKASSLPASYTSAQPRAKQRAFFTYSSHLIVVSVYYSVVACAYISLASSYSPERNKLVGVLCTAVSPTLNPLIYH
ncbi:olfactory receptor 13A1-like [Tamandua tetradactyla]|uniref:olfactory receptor 13A1-like n=1 Tax=Tamandua tetradactyla TaxID=48850 RepID=UPI0040544A38